MMGEDDHDLTGGEQAIKALVAAAEGSGDPVADLVARAKSDPPSIFEDETLGVLAGLRRSAPGQYEAIRLQLRAAGVPVGRLEAAMRDAGRSEEWTVTRPAAQAHGLAGFLDRMSLFRSPRGTAYADIVIDGHRETIDVASSAFKQWLMRQHYEVYRSAPARDEVSSAIQLATARAQYGGEVHEVHVRLAETEDAVYLDLGDRGWRCIEITSKGWSLAEAPPVRFIRPEGYRELPVPVGDGAIDALRQHVNARNDADFVLIVAWLVAALRARGPYPILVLSGEQGTAKSTLTRILRSLVDPVAVPLAPCPRDERTLFIMAGNTHVAAFDNVSGIRPDLSDALCRLATGGGHLERRLYTDAEMTLIDACRPVIINGIDDCVTRPDLADRSIFIQLAPIADADRKSERQLFEHFERDRPSILGALLDAVAHGLKTIDTVVLEKLPRMADFATWATACEGALWSPGRFARAYDQNRIAGVELVLDREDLARLILRLMDDREEWSGTATQLLARLTSKVDPSTRRSRAWPQTPAQLSTRLKRILPILRTLHVEVSYSREGRNRERIITVMRVRPQGNSPT